ncbi:MAG: hypothetical protein Q7S40_01890 [Opitutaceae bacterium]|nr:hypothetical protein [Opitutaceae bacterium]
MIRRDHLDVRERAPRGQRGASMLGAAIGVFAVGLGLAIAIPAVQAALRNSRAADVAGDLRQFAVAFEAHARQTGSLPPATEAAGEIPAGMQSQPGANWTRGSATGRYLWAPDTLQRGRRYRAAIVLWRDHTRLRANERRLLEEIDRRVDDGYLLSGKFQLGYRDQAFFVIEP